MQKNAGRIFVRADKKLLARFYTAKAGIQQKDPTALTDAEFARKLMDIALKQLEKDLK